MQFILVLAFAIVALAAPTTEVDLIARDAAILAARAKVPTGFVNCAACVGLGAGGVAACLDVPLDAATCAPYTGAFGTLTISQCLECLNDPH